MKYTHENNEDTLQAYFQQLKKTPLLSFDEELDLSRRIQQGDEIARQKLIKANLRLVVKISKVYVNSEVSFLDIIQEGNLGLIKAASKYDHRKNVRFSTYAAWWIKQAIVRYLSGKKRAIRLPHRKEDLLIKIKKTYYELNQKLERKPTVMEIAEELNLKSDDVISVLNNSWNIVSLDKEIKEENGNMLDILEDSTFDPDRAVFKKSLHEDTMKFLEHLLTKEKQILMYRFSFYGGKKYTLKKISEELGISPETVRQIEIRAIKKLRKHGDELREYIYN